MNKSISILAIIIFFLGCKKDGESISDLIIGKWDWVESVSPWTGLVSNPQTIGYSITLEFTCDRNLKEYRNDTLISSTSFTIEINSNDPDKYFLIYGTEIRSQVSLVNDSLILNSAYLDGPVSKYIRLR
jgi:hypothetical protein